MVRFEQYARRVGGGPDDIGTGPAFGPDPWDTAEIVVSRVAILHLEDSPLDAELVRARLERAGLGVAVTRAAGREAFVAALAAGGVDLILADYQLPDFDGLAALEVARALRPEVPFLFVSGTLGEELAIESLKRGATDYVVKLRLDRLAPAVGRALAEARERAVRRAAEADRDRALAEARAARDEAEAANRMKDQFLATLSHELRTPLNAILGWAKLLGTGKLPPDSAREGLEVIERNALAQARLINDLLDVSRIITGKLKLDVAAVDVADVVRAAVASAQPAAEAKGVAVEARVDAHALVVDGDATRLQQVAGNLLSNAVKFTPPGGRVGVAVRAAGADVVLEVRDTGDGIDPAFLPHLFDRFRQADPSTTRRHGGLGLGLSIVRQLVEAHGGAVAAESPGRGRGSTFTVTLPRTACAAAVAAPPAGDGASLAGVRVLVVDDERDSREMARLALAGAGAEVDLAGSAADALDRLAARPPDVLVSDIGMPGRDGYDLIRAVRAGGGPAAVALTAFAGPDDRRRAVAAGFDAHLAKPVDPAALVAAVAALAGGRGR